MRHNSHLHTSMSALALAAALGVTQTAHAQSATPQAGGEAAGSGEIIVTAQRKAESISKVPLSITALGNDALETKQVTEMKDLQFASPGIRAGQQQGVTRIFIRGIGLTSFSAGADPSVAFYADGVYVGRPTAQASSFYDVERIEVLRGPQGTLYGRNATGGAVNVISRAPTRELSGYANLTYGNYDLKEFEGGISGPLTEGGDLRARVSGHVIDRDGYGYDFGMNHDFNDAKSQSVRTQLQYENGNGTDIRLIGEYHHENDYNNGTTSFGAYPGYELQGVVGTVDPDGNELKGIAVTGGQDTATALVGKTNVREGWAVTLNANFDISDRLHFNSITGFRKWDRYNGSNSDGTSAGLGNTYYNEKSKQFSQELVLNWSAGPLDLVAGTSFYWERLDNYVLVPFVQFGTNYIQDGTMDIESFSAYGQATVHVLDSLRLTAGGRYSTETRDSKGTFTFFGVTDVSGQKTWSDFNPKFGIEFDLNPDTLLYATATNGFKSGTFNVGQVNPAINPEKIWSYEAGFKTKLFDNAVQLSGAYFHYDYTDLQVNKVIGIATVTTNAAAAKVDGLELAATIKPFSGLTLDTSFTYLDARFSEFFSTNPLYPGGASDPGYAIWLAANPDAKTPVFDGDIASEQNLKGYQLPGAPKYAATAGIQYDYDMDNGARITLRGDAAYASRIHFSEFNDVHLSQKAVTKFNAYVRYDSGKLWTLSVWGKNLTNETVKSNELVTIALWGYPRYGAIEPPRTYGATVGLKF
ncbi:TonB-dependent receptor [Novosphingobium colocasiae]|uniref:TonB-dependent receptor n=3 Tax=Bacteria TaxID=2 RepID=A0A918PJP5_9SPHN|nr:TonB-dependent receptor [Novosphingobium colocasiae]